MKPILFVVWVVCLVFAVADRVHAQPGGDQARAHYNQGRTLAASGKFAEAYREFEAGFEISQRAAFLFNMGEAARGMGDLAKARSAYERYLAMEATGDLATRARARLAEMGAGAPTSTAPPPPTAGDAEPSVDFMKVPAPAEAAASVEASRPAGEVHAMPAQPESKPIWKKWPFWAAVAAGVVTTSVIIVAVSSGDDGECGANCIDFRGGR